MRRNGAKAARLNRNLFIYHHGQTAFRVMVSGMKKITAITKAISVQKWNTVEEYLHMKQ